VFSGINKDKPMARVTQRAKHARKGQRAARKLDAVSRGRGSVGKKPPRRSGSPARTRAKSKSRARQHTFIASHHRPDAFEQGLRRYAHYRDLGIAGATGGMVRAHVIKMIPPCDPAEVSKRHFHDVEFQMVYVLKGWIKGEYEGAGVVTMREGSCWLQPPKIEHSVLDYSDDCELLEIIMPADFATVELE
jgi:mannose-6-phosphate isomerase-like protein (cupin superfamily)